MLATVEPITPSDHDTRHADEGSRLLARLMGDQDTLRLHPAGADAEEIVLPANLARLVRDVLACVAQGQPVPVLPLQAELTTNQAADLLGVSRTHLIRLLEAGEIAFRQVGTKRRIPVSDLLRYREENKARRLQALAELQAQAQELDMGY